MGVQARLMSQAMRKLTSVVSRNLSTVVFINQIRMKIGVVFGNPETTGGQALKFYASIRLDIRRIGQVKDGEQVVGSRTRVKVVKNKVAPPFREAEFDVRYGVGVDRLAEALDLGVVRGIVEKSGAYFSLDGSGSGRGGSGPARAPGAPGGARLARGPHRRRPRATGGHRRGLLRPGGDLTPRRVASSSRRAGGESRPARTGPRGAASPERSARPRKPGRVAGGQGRPQAPVGAHPERARHERLPAAAGEQEVEKPGVFGDPDDDERGPVHRHGGVSRPTRTTHPSPDGSRPRQSTSSVRLVGHRLAGTRNRPSSSMESPGITQET